MPTEAIWSGVTWLPLSGAQGAQGVQGGPGAQGGSGAQGAQGTTVEVYIFSVTGAVAVATGKSRVYLEGNYTVESIRAAVNTAPTGASLIVDVNKNGTTLFTTQGNRPTIAAAGFQSTATLPDVLTFVAGDYLTVDVDQIGSTVAGSDLTVTIRLRKT